MLPDKIDMQMENFLISTLTQDIANLREQLSLLERRAETLRTALGELETLLDERQAVLLAASQAPVVAAVPAEPAEQPQSASVPLDAESGLPEIEVELIVCDDDDEPLDADLSPEQPIAEPLPAEPETLSEPVEEPSRQESLLQESVPSPAVEDKESPAEKPAGVNLPPVDDIRKAISLGDRFLFQRELFGGDGEKMNKTIEALNALPSLEKALEYIEKKFHWDTETTSYELFLNILKRRY